MNLENLCADRKWSEKLGHLFEDADWWWKSGELGPEGGIK